ncbi:nucleotidyltransferase family protein [Colwellia sp. MEBiC06753]
MSKPNLSVIILAAGNSSRLGQPKQLVQYQGKTLLNRAIALAKAVSKHIVVVLGADATRIAASIENEVDSKVEINDETNTRVASSLVIKINENWASGLGSSIAVGVKALHHQKNQQTDAVLLMLVDQWQLTRSDITRLYQQYCQNPTKIIASSWQENINEGTTFGPPVIFPKAMFTNLTELSGNRGAKPIIVSDMHNCELVPMASAGADLDTPEQLHSLRLGSVDIKNK